MSISTHAKGFEWLLIASVAVAVAACADGDDGANTGEAQAEPEMPSTGEMPDMSEPETAEPSGVEPEAAEPDAPEPNAAEPSPPEPTLEPDSAEPSAAEPDAPEPNAAEPSPPGPVPEPTSTPSAGSCDPVDPCGGDLEGTWQVTAVCVDPDAIAAALTEELPPECADIVESVEVTPADFVTTFQDGMTSTSGALSFEMSLFYSAECLLTLNAEAEASQEFCDQVGVQAGAPCTFVDGGCQCDVVQTSPIESADEYEVENGQLIDSDGSQTYCVEGDTLQVSSIEGETGMGSYTAERLQ